MGMLFLPAHVGGIVRAEMAMRTRAHHQLTHCPLMPAFAFLHHRGGVLVCIFLHRHDRYPNPPVLNGANSGVLARPWPAGYRHHCALGVLRRVPASSGRV